jgi:hypothetical protein
MRKTRSEARWLTLSPEQIETLDSWLFEQKFSYAKTFHLAQAKLGFQGSISSLKRYGQRRANERLMTTLVETGKDAVKASNTGATPDELRNASLRVLGVYLFQALRENPDAIKEMMPVVKAMLQNDYNETLRESKAEDRKLRREQMAFAKEKYEFDVTEKALKALPQLHELAQARKDPLTKRYEANTRRNRLRRMMFGAGADVQPENAQEEAEMLAAKQEREERKRQLAAPSQAESLTGPPTHSSQYYGTYLEWRKKKENMNPDIGCRGGHPTSTPTTIVGANAEHPEDGKSCRESQALAKQAEEAKRAEAEKQAEAEKRRKYREARARFEEIKEICGWQELSRPPGWMDMEGWKDAPLEWDAR